MANGIVEDEHQALEQVKEAAGDSKDELFQVLALIHAAFDLAAGGGNLMDADQTLTDATSRLQSLLVQARDKTVGAINHLGFV